MLEKDITLPRCNPVPEIRRGQISDLEAIAGIQAASPQASQWPPHQYLEYEVWVAGLSGRVEGFLVARTLAPGESEILNLAVSPRCRRLGLARALCEAWLRDFHGAAYLEVRESNEGAIKFYKSLGFKELTVRPQYYGSPSETGIVMKFHSC